MVLVDTSVWSDHGRGFGFVDIHLLVSARVVHAAVRTRDKCLAAATAVLGCLYPSPAG